MELPQLSVHISSPTSGQHSNSSKDPNGTNLSSPPQYSDLSSPPTQPTLLPPQPRSLSIQSQQSYEEEDLEEIENNARVCCGINLMSRTALFAPCAFAILLQYSQGNSPLARYNTIYENAVWKLGSILFITSSILPNIPLSNPFKCDYYKKSSKRETGSIWMRYAIAAVATFLASEEIRGLIKHTFENMQDKWLLEDEIGIEKRWIRNATLAMATVETCLILFIFRKQIWEKLTAKCEKIYSQ